LSAAGLWLTGARRPSAGAAAFMAAALLVGAGVNPIRIGVFNWNTTAAGKTVAAINAKDPGHWVVLDGVNPGLVMEADVSAFTGIQAFPNRITWRQFDPNGQYKNVWNRYAHIMWTSDQTASRIANPQRDVITIRFDPCASYEQQHLGYAISDRPVTSQCLAPIETVHAGQTVYYYYRLVKQ
ncbi:MAG: hypothetical protein LBM66_02640, partial [Bifidobacteriaceae bacterium]|nr:hypothetical protein [Bifidobacteriaceae bacterium]